MNITPKSEPVAFNGAITALVIAAIPLLRAFNVQISEAQSDAVLVFVAALVGVVTVLVRSRVTPNQTANDKIDQAFAATPGVDAKPTL